MAGTLLTRAIQRTHAGGRGAGRRIFICGTAVPVPLRRGQGSHRPPLERFSFFWTGQEQGIRPMIKPNSTNGRPSVRCAIYTRKSTEEGLDQEFNTSGRPARIGRSLHQESGARRLALPAGALRRWRFYRRQHGPPGAQTPDGRHRSRPDRLRRRLQGRPLEPLAVGLRADDGDFSNAQGVVRLGHAAVQHGHLDGPLDAQRAACRLPSSSGR